MSNNRLMISILALVIILVGLGWFLTAKGLIPGSYKKMQSAASSYHALFLSNGQVYFGKMSNQNGQYIKLADIFYLQVQPTEGQQAQDKKEQPNVSLVKLGNELHGPVDEMSINRDHVLFIEQMKNDAKVIEAIEKYKKDGPQQPQATAPAESPKPAASPASTR